MKNPMLILDRKTRSRPFDHRKREAVACPVLSCPPFAYEPAQEIRFWNHGHGTATVVVFTMFGARLEQPKKIPPNTWIPLGLTHGKNKVPPCALLTQPGVTNLSSGILAKGALNEAAKSKIFTTPKPPPGFGYTATI